MVCESISFTLLVVAYYDLSSSSNIPVWIQLLCEKFSPISFKVILHITLFDCMKKAEQILFESSILNLIEAIVQLIIPPFRP